MKTICDICPRKCKIDRNTTKGFCKASNSVQISKVMRHFWEEPIISGDENTKKRGSGSIFFSGCNLKCVFCQNYEISHKNNGKVYTIEQLAMQFKKFEEEGATNINLVTPTHYTTQILQALDIYTPNIPIVWNSSGYESPETIKKLFKKVKVFLFDFKYFSNEIANKYSSAPNYFENCTECLKLIKKQFPKNIIKDGILQEGLIIRHMVLPNNLKDSENVLVWIKDNLGADTCISLLSQYTPYGESEKYPEINRKLKPIEYKKIVRILEKLGFDNGYTQELSSASTNYIPDFDAKNNKKA